MMYYRVIERYARFDVPPVLPDVPGLVTVSNVGKLRRRPADHVLSVRGSPAGSLQKWEIDSDGTFEVLEFSLYRQHRLSRVRRFFG